MWFFKKEKKIICININKNSITISLIDKYQNRLDEYGVSKVYLLNNGEIIDKKIFNIAKISKYIEDFVISNKIKKPILNICLQDIIYETLNNKAIINSDMVKIDSINWQKHIIKLFDEDYYYHAGINFQLIIQLHIIANLVSAEINFISCPTLIYCKILELFNKKIEFTENDANIESLNIFLKEQINKLKEVEKFDCKFDLKNNDDTFFITSAMGIYFMEKHG